MSAAASSRKLTEKCRLCWRHLPLCSHICGTPTHPQVLDRVLLQSGSHKWWAALIGRGKMQRAWNQHTAMTIVSDTGVTHGQGQQAAVRSTCRLCCLTCMPMRTCEQVAHAMRPCLFTHTHTHTHSQLPLCLAPLPAPTKTQTHTHTHTPQRENLSDPHNYALAATGRLQLSDSTVLRATLQVGLWGP